MRVEGKGGRQRVVPTGRLAAEAARRYLARGRPYLGKTQEAAAFLLNARGRRISRQGVFRLVRATPPRWASSRPSRRTCCATRSRRTCSSRAPTCGSVQELLGHASVATTEIYTHLGDGALRKAFDGAHPRARRLKPRVGSGRVPARLHHRARRRRGGRAARRRRLTATRGRTRWATSPRRSAGSSCRTCRSSASATCMPLEGCPPLPRAPSRGRPPAQALARQGHHHRATGSSWASSRQRPLPTYPDGFPHDVIDAFAEATGRGVLGNVPASGTEIIQRLGDEHVRTGKWIVYTSADSVFQIAAHEEVVPLDELYAACRTAREHADRAARRRARHRAAVRGRAGAYPRTAEPPRLLARAAAAEPPRAPAGGRARACTAWARSRDVFAGQDVDDSRPRIERRGHRSTICAARARSTTGSSSPTSSRPT